MMLLRDIDRMQDAVRRMNVSPIGCCALAGTTYDTDRFFEAKQLGFDDVARNSLDGVSDRDFCVELLDAYAIEMMHLSRLSEELVLWSSWEFQFVQLSDSYTTGSSIMPQKKNPDMAELVRGKTAALFSAATESGAEVAGAEAAVQQALFDYGDALGIAFQIVDDLLDYGGSAQVIGKNVGDDFRERKLTLPVIKAIAAADANERAFWERTIGKGKQDEGDLETALEILQRRGALSAARADAIAWANRAKAALQACPDQPLRVILSDLADYVVSRLS
jgi:hypothetical protein